MARRKRHNPKPIGKGAKIAIALGVGLGLTFLARRAFASEDEYGEGGTYAPGTPEQISLFEQAADRAGVPRWWARSPALFAILKSESGGKVGIPNYLWRPWVEKQGLSWDSSSWPAVWKVIREGNARPSYTGISSHAAGLGQLQPGNMNLYQPNGIKGVGKPLEEAIGMLRYIKARYGTMEKAWDFWQANHMY